MSTSQPFDSQSQPFVPPPVPVGSPSEEDSPPLAPQTGAASESFSNQSKDDHSSAIDPQLIQQTKLQIRSMVNEISQLAQSDISQEVFYDGFLNRVVSALASVGGAIWTLDDSGSLKRQFQINLAETGLLDNQADQTRHALLLRKVIADGKPTIALPHSGAEEDTEAGNPTDSLLILGVLKIDQETHGVVEIFQRAGRGPATQRGYLRFLIQMCDLASDYLKSRQLRRFSDRQALWESLEQFIRGIYRSLDPRDVAYTIANEGRRLIECDRVSVALMQGNKCRIEAVSGLDSIDRRAEEVARLGRLASAVVAAGQPLWYFSDSDDLPPQIEEKLQQYLDRSHAKTLAVLPLMAPQDTKDASAKTSRSQKAQKPIGALIVEQLRDQRSGDPTGGEGLTGWKRRTEVVAEHSAGALANALEHHGLFLMPLWRAIGKASWLVRAQALPKTLLITMGLVAAVAALIVVPADFDLAVQGKLQPASRQEIFARHDGVVYEVPVQHGQMVTPGQVLARMRDNDMEVEIAALEGDKTTTQEQIQSLERTLLDNSRLNINDQNRYSGELLEKKQYLINIEQRLALYQEKEKQLVLKSEEHGKVVTWQVGETLLYRPVQKGQILMSVVDSSGDWELELYAPERRMGHISAAYKESPDNLKVIFILSSHAGLEIEGRVVEIHHKAEMHGEEGNSALIRVALDKDQLPLLRSETTVSARIQCGRRSVGYVWFCDAIETIQAKILFWL